MTAKELFNNISNIYADDTVAVEDGNKIRIIPSQSLLTIEISSDIHDADKSMKLIDTVNKGQSLARYEIIDSTLILRTTLWVDVKPTKSALTEVVNLALAQFNSTKSLIGGVLNEQ